MTEPIKNLMKEIVDIRGEKNVNVGMKGFKTKILEKTQYQTPTRLTEDTDKDQLVSEPVMSKKI